MNIRRNSTYARSKHFCRYDLNWHIWPPQPSLLNTLYQKAWMLKWSTVFSLVFLWNLVIYLRKVIKINPYVRFEAFTAVLLNIQIHLRCDTVLLATVSHPRKNECSWIHAFLKAGRNIGVPACFISHKNVINGRRRQAAFRHIQGNY